VYYNDHIRAAWLTRQEASFGLHVATVWPGIPWARAGPCHFELPQSPREETVSSTSPPHAPPCPPPSFLFLMNEDPSSFPPLLFTRLPWVGDLEPFRYLHEAPGLFYEPGWL
jgi:hypothetical protein